VTDDEGRYRLENVPPGTYSLTVWNETFRGDAR
jgi:protocatechuate 3,4-dioxygenase beta subunit